MGTTQLGSAVFHSNGLTGRDRDRADLAARNLAVKLARPAATVVLTPRLFSESWGDGCDLCGQLGQVFDDVWWTEWENRREFTNHIWLVHRRCLVPTIQRACDLVAGTYSEVVLVNFGLRRDTVPATFYPSEKAA